MPNQIHKALLGLAVVCLLISVVLGVLGKFELMGALLSAGFFSAALGFRGFKLQRGFSYPLMIFGAVAIALADTGFHGAKPSFASSSVRGRQL